MTRYSNQVMRALPEHVPESIAPGDDVLVCCRSLIDSPLARRAAWDRHVESPPARMAAVSVETDTGSPENGTGIADHEHVVRARFGRISPRSSRRCGPGNRNETSLSGCSTSSCSGSSRRGHSLSRSRSRSRRATTADGRRWRGRLWSRARRLRCRRASRSRCRRGRRRGAGRSRARGRSRRWPSCKACRR